MGLRLGTPPLVAVALAVLGAAGPLWAQGGRAGSRAAPSDTAVLLGVALEVELDPGHASAEVVVRHRLEGGADARVPVVVFLPAGVIVRGLVAEDATGKPLPLALEPPGEHVLAGTLTLPAPAAGGAARTAVFRYRVARAGVSGTPRADRFDVSVPVALVRTRAGGSPEGFFAARVSLPEAWGIWESFPVARTEEHVADGLRHAQLTLPVVPSFVRLRGGTGDRPALGVPEAVDLGMAVVILLLSALGWRWASRQTRAPAGARASGRTPTP